MIPPLASASGPQWRDSPKAVIRSSTCKLVDRTGFHVGHSSLWYMSVGIDKTGIPTLDHRVVSGWSE
jgi:hypothetical protein